MKPPARGTQVPSGEQRPPEPHSESALHWVLAGSAQRRAEQTSPVSQSASARQLLPFWDFFLSTKYQTRRATPTPKARIMSTTTMTLTAELFFSCGDGGGSTNARASILSFRRKNKRSRQRRERRKCRERYLGELRHRVADAIAL